MRIGVLGYDFEHRRTQDGLLHLFAAGVDVHSVLAAPWVELTVQRSQIPIGAKGIRYHHPRQLAARVGARYDDVPHDSEQCAATVREQQLDLGIILGARILPASLIEAFDIGVINLHPGLLPHNRGLDALKWAVHQRLPQGVSVHFIDSAVDQGWLIDRRIVDVRADDTLLDVNLRLENTELFMLCEALERIDAGARPGDFPVLGRGFYHSTIPPEMETEALASFDDYRRDYESIVAGFNAQEAPG